MAKSSHPNSKVVTIFRKASFLMNAQEKTAPEFLAQAKKSIGSYWDSTVSRAVGSGLEFWEQKILMPQIIDCEVEDRNFRTKVTEYFQNMKTTVPYPKGIELEIGMEVSNDEALSPKNLPLNIADYIAYRHAIRHPLVALNKDAAEASGLKEFYVFDPQASEDARLKVNKDRDNALKLYLEISQQSEKHDMLLTLFKIDPRTLNSKKNAGELKLEAIKKIVDSRPGDFIKMLDNKFFEDLYWIESMVLVGVLKKMGESMIIDPLTGETIGNNMDEAIAWMRSDANSPAVAIYRSSTKEKLAPQTATEKAI